MSGKGVKRASPGAEDQKNPLGEVELSDEDAGKLQELQRHYARVELAVGAQNITWAPCRGVLTRAILLQSATRPTRCSPSSRSGGRS